MLTWLGTPVPMYSWYMSTLLAESPLLAVPLCDSPVMWASPLECLCSQPLNPHTSELSRILSQRGEETQAWQCPHTATPGALQTVYPTGYPCLALSKSACPPIPGTHLKQALPLAQAASFQAPEVDVGLPTGDQQAGISGVEGGHQHGLIGALSGGQDRF